LPNLHDDCRICTGGFEGDQETALECVRASLEQFNQSKWNSDLMRTIEQSQKFFRFRPTKETFETLPILGEKEPDAMQVAAHAMLLKEHGITAVRGAIYYAADKRRVPVEFSEELFSKVRKAIEEARAGPSASDATLVIEAMGLPYEVRSRVTII
jgi:hypothetical protein